MAKTHNYTYVRADASDALYQGLDRDATGEAWQIQDIDATHALGLFNAGGDGLIVQGTPAEILTYIDFVHAHDHSAFGAAR